MGHAQLDKRDENVKDPVGRRKRDTFPIARIPLKHPVKAAFDAASTDIGDSV
jgi:uncharacterized protein (UPF0371 family)